MPRRPVRTLLLHGQRFLPSVAASHHQTLAKHIFVEQKLPLRRQPVSAADSRRAKATAELIRLIALTSPSRLARWTSRRWPARTDLAAW